jgi:quercetin dioxygenase-like cupin family protein
MSNLEDLADRPLLEIWGDAVRARRVQGDRITLAFVELAPNAVVPEHRHAAEQLGLDIRGQMHFTVDGETRDLGLLNFLDETAPVAPVEPVATAGN